MEDGEIEELKVKPTRTKKNRKKVGKIRIGFTEDNYSPPTDDQPPKKVNNVNKPKLEFDNPEIQAYYANQISKKELAWILSLPEKEWKMWVKESWKKNNKNKNKI